MLPVCRRNREKKDIGERWSRCCGRSPPTLRAKTMNRSWEFAAEHIRRHAEAKKCSPSRFHSFSRDLLPIVPRRLARARIFGSIGQRSIQIHLRSSRSRNRRTDLTLFLYNAFARLRKEIWPGGIFRGGPSFILLLPKLNFYLSAQVTTSRIYTKSDRRLKSLNRLSSLRSRTEARLE